VRVSCIAIVVSTVLLGAWVGGCTGHGLRDPGLPSEPASEDVRGDDDVSDRNGASAPSEEATEEMDEDAVEIHHLPTEQEWFDLLYDPSMPEGESLDFYAVHSAPAAEDDYAYNPISAIRSINYFVSVGRQRTVDALLDYALRYANATEEERKQLQLDDCRVFVLTVALFGVEDSRKRPPRAYWMHGRSIDVEVWPTFPVSHMDDLPLLLSPFINYDFLEARYFPAWWWFREYYADRDIRQTPLVPSNTPRATADVVYELGIEIWKDRELRSRQGRDPPHTRHEYFRMLLDEQVQRCLEHVAPEDWESVTWSAQKQSFVVPE